jgi:hypothetical protein
MSKDSKEQRAPRVPRPCVVFAVYQDNPEDAPLTWAVVTGTADLADIEVRDTVTGSNPLMTKAFLVRAIDELELLR